LERIRLRVSAGSGGGDTAGCQQGRGARISRFIRSISELTTLTKRHRRGDTVWRSRRFVTSTLKNCSSAARHGGSTSGRLLLILDVLNRAEGLTDVATLPGFHPLAGDRQGHHAVTITGNYRVTFRMEGQDIHDVDYLDYH
jgi:plasmid maintenance system killer protein